MTERISASTVILVACGFGLTGCDPGVHIAWEKQFEGSIDDRCIERALKSVAPDVGRGTYISDGSRGFPSGTEVIQFSYDYGAYSLDIAALPNGKTNYYHQWGKIGTDIPTEERAKVLPLLNKANGAVAEQCGLSFAGSQPQQGDG